MIKIVITCLRTTFRENFHTDGNSTMHSSSSTLSPTYLLTYPDGRKYLYQSDCLNHRNQRRTNGSNGGSTKEQTIFCLTSHVLALWNKRREYDFPPPMTSHAYALYWKFRWAVHKKSIRGNACIKDLIGFWKVVMGSWKSIWRIKKNLVSRVVNTEGGHMFWCL